MTTNNHNVVNRDTLATYRRDFLADDRKRLAMNAVTRTNIQEIILNRELINLMNFNFTNEIETSDVSDQARANTCWLFANMNWLRTLTMKKIKVKSFEFSENYLMFYDKLEKSNFFLNNMIDLRERDLDDRLVAHMLNDPNPDGGEWHMTANLLEKYGIVPKEIMPDTFNRENSRYPNELINLKLREGAYMIRQLHEQGKTEAELREFAASFMKEMYAMNAIFFGIPPETFSWSFKDEDKRQYQEIDITPCEFYRKYVGLDVDDLYALLSCPARETPFGKTFTVDYFNNMSGKRRLHYLNVPMDVLKGTAVEIIKQGEAVMFGCDVRYQSHTKDGIMAENLLDYSLLFDTPFRLNKGERVEYLHVRLTHSMVLTGVDLVNGKPVKWKVENSWGDKVGRKGYFVMSDEWFDEYGFDLLVPKRYLSSEMIEAFKQEPIVLPVWHPLG